MNSRRTRNQKSDDHLGLGVRSGPPECAVTPQVSDLLVHLVSQLQGERHALGGLVSGVPEHQALKIRKLLKLIWKVA